MIRAALATLFAIKRWPGSVIAGAVLGLALVPLTNEGVGAAVRAYYRLRPIVTFQTSVVSANAKAIVLRVIATRRDAPECEYVRTVGYTVDRQGQLQDATVQRLDAPAKGASKAPGTHDLGRWIVWPRSDGVQVRVDIVHACAARIITSTVVLLPVP